MSRPGHCPVSVGPATRLPCPRTLHVLRLADPCPRGHQTWPRATMSRTAWCPLPTSCEPRPPGPWPPPPRPEDRAAVSLPAAEPGNFSYQAHARPSPASDTDNLKELCAQREGRRSGQPAPTGQPNGLGDAPRAPRPAHPARASAAPHSTHGGRSLPARLGLPGSGGAAGAEARPAPQLPAGGPQKAQQADARRGQPAGCPSPPRAATDPASASAALAAVLQAYKHRELHKSTPLVWKPKVRAFSPSPGSK